MGESILAALSAGHGSADDLAYLNTGLGAITAWYRARRR